MAIDMCNFHVCLWTQYICTGFLLLLRIHGTPPALRQWSISRPANSVFAISFSPHYWFSNFFFTRYRTLSIHVEEKSSRATPDKLEADSIRQIDVHTIPVDLVYQRFSTSSTLGLDSSSVARLTQTFGKNVISPPKTLYWKKVLNYIFGGFNFLMWIAFFVTIVILLNSFYESYWWIGSLL